QETNTLLPMITNPINMLRVAGSIESGSPAPKYEHDLSNAHLPDEPIFLTSVSSDGRSHQAWPCAPSQRGESPCRRSSIPRCTSRPGRLSENGRIACR